MNEMKTLHSVNRNTDSTRSMRKSASPKQVARAIGVGESTLKRWCDRGLISMTKTAGGHRRIELDAVIRFLQKTGREIVDPAILGLPVSVGRTEWTLGRATERLIAALVDGEEAVVRQVAFDLLLAGHTVTTIFDNVFAPAFHSIGERWNCGEVAVYQERRACEISMRCLHELRHTVPLLSSQAPVAIGATLSSDHYTLPVTMAEIVLQSVGWRATAIGTNMPFEALITAVQELKPRLVWLSISFVPDGDAFVSGLNELFETTHASGAALAVGGQFFRPDLRAKTQVSVSCATFRELEMFARTLHPHASAPTGPIESLP